MKDIIWVGLCPCIVVSTEDVSTEHYTGYPPRLDATFDRVRKRIVPLYLWLFPVLYISVWMKSVINDIKFHMTGRPSKSAVTAFEVKIIIEEE